MCHVFWWLSLSLPCLCSTPARSRSARSVSVSAVCANSTYVSPSCGTRGLSVCVISERSLYVTRELFRSPVTFFHGRASSSRARISLVTYIVLFQPRLFDVYVRPPVSVVHQAQMKICWIRWCEVLCLLFDVLWYSTEGVEATQFNFVHFIQVGNVW